MKRQQLILSLKKLGIPVTAKGLVRKSDIKKALAEESDFDIGAIEGDMFVLSRAYKSIVIDFVQDELEGVFDRLKQEFLTQAPDEHVDRIKALRIRS